MEKTVKAQDFYMALRKANEEIRDSHIDLCDMGEGNEFFDRKVKIGVNWPCRGTVSAEEATAFAAELTKAAELAANFHYNGYKIKY